jgi:hypothetical protein
MQVLVVGAGPVGLTMASELARYGVRCRMIDMLAAPSGYCKAIGVTPRTLEVWENMGVARPIIDAGLWLRGMRMIIAGQQRDSVLSGVAGGRQERFRDGQTERLGGLEIDHQVVLCRRLHGQISRLLAPQDAIDVAGGLSILLDDTESIGDQTAIRDEETSRIHCGQLVLCCQHDDQTAMNRRRVGRRRDQTAIRRACESRDAVLDLTRVTHVDRGDLHFERWRQRLDSRKLGCAGALGCISKDRRARYVRCDLLKQFQPFRAHHEFDAHETSQVATRPRQAVDEAGTDRVAEDRKHDRHAAGHL